VKIGFPGHSHLRNNAIRTLLFVSHEQNSLYFILIKYDSQNYSSLDRLEKNMSVCNQKYVTRTTDWVSFLPTKNMFDLQKMS
jgi:hypothetical protein